MAEEGNVSKGSGSPWSHCVLRGRARPLAVPEFIFNSEVYLNQTILEIAVLLFYDLVV